MHYYWRCNLRLQHISFLQSEIDKAIKKEAVHYYWRCNLRLQHISFLQSEIDKAIKA